MWQITWKPDVGFRPDIRLYFRDNEGKQNTCVKKQSYLKCRIGGVNVERFKKIGGITSIG